jgi:hypothetical protein
MFPLLLYNIKTDISIFLFRLKLHYHVYRYISSVQAKTFNIILQLNGSMNGLRRYSIDKIVNNIMLLQELLIDKDGNSLSYYKIQKVRVVTNYIISRNSFISDGFDMDRSNTEQIKSIIYEIVDTLLVDNYLNEKEIRAIINKHRIQLKYKRK